MPGPAFPAGSGSEVSAAEVHDARGEAQQAAVSVGPVHPGGGGRQAVLLVSTGQEVQWSILQVGRLLDQLGVKDQVRGGCGGGSSQLITCFTDQPAGGQRQHEQSPHPRMCRGDCAQLLLDSLSAHVTPAALPSPPLGQ